MQSQQQPAPIYMPAPPQQRGCLHSITGFFASIGLVGILGICLCCSVTVIGIGLIAWGADEATREAVEQNAGRGRRNNPIAAGEWIKFEEGNVRAVRIVRPATDFVNEQMGAVDVQPAVGADFLVIWFELQCKKDFCDENELDIQLIDTQDSKWPEAVLPLFISGFDDAVEGSTTAGWQVFEFPQNREIELIEVKWGAARLYVRPPAPE